MKYARIAGSKRRKTNWSRERLREGCPFSPKQRRGRLPIGLKNLGIMMLIKRYCNFIVNRLCILLARDLLGALKKFSSMTQRIT